nr:hypothetical protein [Tanacetum cinerariifolium]
MEGEAKIPTAVDTNDRLIPQIRTKYNDTT